MNLTEEQIKKIIREEIGKRYTLLYDKDIVKSVSRLDELGPLVIPLTWKGIGIAAAVLGGAGLAAGGFTLADNVGDIDVNSDNLTDQEKLTIAFGGEGGAI